MNWQSWDETDWLKFGSYVLGGIAAIATIVGSKQNAAAWGAASTFCGVIGGAIDLLEPPKHCGQRTAYNPQMQAYYCQVCGRRVSQQPKLGFE